MLGGERVWSYTSTYRLVSSKESDESRQGQLNSKTMSKQGEHEKRMSTSKGDGAGPEHPDVRSQLL
jgi:hypothetical protein